MEYLEFRKLIDSLTAKPKETEWLELNMDNDSHKNILHQLGAEIVLTSKISSILEERVGHADSFRYRFLEASLVAHTKMLPYKTYMARTINRRVDLQA